jgi:hypothetical protein
MKIAILILIHKNADQAAKLIEHLSVDFDIYIHIDKRCKIDPQLRNKARVFSYRKYKTFWGSLNLVNATLFLLSEAFKKSYDRYLLVSGMDIPVKTNGEIIDFFKKNEEEYIEIEKLPRDFWNDENGGFDRVLKFWPVLKKRENKTFFSRGTYKIKRVFSFIISNVYKRPLDYEFYGGSQWFNITHNCVTKMFKYLSTNKIFLRRFRFTYCPDELFFQTLVNMLDLKINNNSLRYVDWETGPEYPRILRKENYLAIIESECLFARKFDPTVDGDIVDLIYKKIQG